MSVVVRRWRTATLARLDRSPSIRGRVERGAHRWAVRRGADPGLVAAVVDADLTLERTLQALQWATALAGAAPFPNHFDPGDHLKLDDHRRLAADAIRSATIPDPDGRLRRQQLGVDDDVSLHDLAGAVEADLSGRLEAASRRPKRGGGLDPSLQIDLAGAITDRLEQRGIRPFLMSGSLLGVVRDGGFMAHDYDIDLGLLPGVDHELVMGALSEATDLKVEVIGPRTLVTSPTGAMADIFEHEHRDDLFWHATLIHEWWNTPFGVKQIDVGGRPMWIPDEPERYLTENYGDWSSSVVFFDISFDTPNRRYRDNHHALRYLHSRCLRALATNDRWLMEASVRELRESFGIDVSRHLAATGLLLARGELAPGHRIHRPV